MYLPFVVFLLFSVFYLMFLIDWRSCRLVEWSRHVVMPQSFWVNSFCRGCW